MKEAEAIKIVRNIMLAGQRYRSIMAESLGTDEVAQNLLADLTPRLFGKVNVVDMASRILDAAEKSGQLAPGDFLNLMIFVNLDPALARQLELTGRVDIPEADVSVVQGWEV